MINSPRSRGTEILHGLGALVLFAILLVGFPIGLYAVAGSPIPGRLPSWDGVTAALMSPDTDQSLFLNTVRLLGWAAWLAFTAATCIETISYLAGRPTPALPRPARPLQLLARDLVATATLAFSATAALTTSASATDHTLPTNPPPQTASTHTPQQATEGSSDNSRGPFLGTAPSNSQELPDQQTRAVEQGDTLWDIARRTYGSGALYPKIFKSSRTLDQPDGIPALTDPDLLYPGQHLRLPRTREHDPAPQKSRRTTNPETMDSPITPRPAKEGDNSAAPAIKPSTPTAPSTPSQAPTPVAPPPSQQPPRPATPTPSPSVHTTDEDGASFAITLYSGSHIGLGLAAALSIALAATRLHRRRRRRPDTGSPEPDPAVPQPVFEAHKAHLDTYADRDVAIPSEVDLVAHDRAIPVPDHIMLGTRADSLITLPLPGLGLGLTGQAAPAVARALTTELLATSNRDRVELLMPQPDAEALYPGSDITEHPTTLPGLTITPSATAAITHLETEILRRARLLETAEQPDLASLRAADPAEPLPALLLVSSVPQQAAHTLQAVVHLGHRYGIGALLLGPWPESTSVHLNADATVTDATGPHANALTGAHLFHLTTTDATGMLNTLRTATGDEPANNPASQDHNTSTADNTPESDPCPKAVLIPPSHPASYETPPPARLQLLGPVRLHTPEGPISTGLRRTARDLLAYLALHPDGITRDQGIAALWTDHHPDAATTQFNTAVSNIRKVLRTATGLREPMFVINTAGRYRLDPHLTDVDLWNLTTTLNQAQQATSDTERISALAPVTNLHSAEFATNLTHEWAQAHREYLRRTIIDALTRLARLQRDDQPDRALATLEQAIHHDPYAEPLYRTVMQLQADLGQLDAAHRTYRLLSTRLADLDTEPDDQTHQLLVGLQQRQAP